MGELPTVFFFARSPEAPRTTMVVFCLSSMHLREKCGQRYCSDTAEAPRAQTRTQGRAAAGEGAS